MSRAGGLDGCYGPVCVEVEPGVWDCLPGLPSWACIRLVHDDKYLVRHGHAHARLSRFGRLRWEQSEGVGVAAFREGMCSSGAR